MGWVEKGRAGRQTGRHPPTHGEGGSGGGWRQSEEEVRLPRNWSTKWRFQATMWMLGAKPLWNLKGIKCSWLLRPLPSSQTKTTTKTTWERLPWQLEDLYSGRFARPKKEDARRWKDLSARELTEITMKTKVEYRFCALLIKIPVTFLRKLKRKNDHQTGVEAQRSRTDGQSNPT